MKENIFKQYNVLVPLSPENTVSTVIGFYMYDDNGEPSNEYIKCAKILEESGEDGYNYKVKFHTINGLTELGNPNYEEC